MFPFRLATAVALAVLVPALAGGAYLQKSATFAVALPAGVELSRGTTLELASGGTLIGSARGIVLRKPGGSLEPFPAGRMLPWNEVTALAEQKPGTVWIGTTRGAIRYETPARIDYFAGRRWLPDDRVRGIGFEAGGAAVWLETAAGLSRIEFRPMTLVEKARLFQERVRARHVRHGLTASSHLLRPGDLGTNQTVSTDNDGLWTAMYVAG